MDPRMLRYYSQELSYMREMGAEFAGQFPKIAARLALDATEVADPYVERLLEGFSFLAARVRLKQDAEFPRFTQHLLEMAYPHYLAPTPAMAIAQFVPTMTEGGLASGFVIPRGTALRGQMPRGEQTACQFRTAHDVTLWPIEVAGGPLRASGARPAAEHAAAGGAGARGPASAAAHGRLAPVPADRPGPPEPVPGGWRRGRPQALRADRSAAASASSWRRPPAPCPGSSGSGARRSSRWASQSNQALIPYTGRSFSGYRLLHEYFAFPERFRFVELVGLRKALARHPGDEIDVVIPLARGDATLGPLVDQASFALHCTPAINLFPRHSDRIHVTDQQAEHQVVVDRTKPMDFEVYAVERVTGYGDGVEAEQEFRPFYASVDADEPGSGAGLLHGAARAAGHSPRGSAGTGRGPATSAARCSCRWSTPARRRTPGGSGSSPSTCSSPTAISRS